MVIDTPIFEQMLEILFDWQLEMTFFTHPKCFLLASTWGYWISHTHAHKRAHTLYNGKNFGLQSLCWPSTVIDLRLIVPCRVECIQLLHASQDPIATIVVFNKQGRKYMIALSYLAVLNYSFNFPPHRWGKKCHTACVIYSYIPCHSGTLTAHMSLMWHLIWGYGSGDHR